MAFEETLVNINREASADLSASQYRFVTVDANGQVAAAGADAALAIGVLQNKPDAAGRAATVAISGVSKVAVGTGGVTAGAEVTTDASGNVVAATAGQNVVGIALETASATALCPVFITHRPGVGV